MSKKYNCFPISEGKSEAEILISDEPINFYIVKPETGEIIEKGHPLEGVSLHNKIIVFPSDTGSSVVQMDGLYQMSKFGNMPKGLIIKYPSTVLVSAAIVMEIPLVSDVDEDFYKDIRDGDILEIDTDSSTITLKK